MREVTAERLCAWSTQLYRVLLFAYPPRLREEFGAEMLDVFHQAMRDEMSRRKRAGIFVAWFRALGEFPRCLSGDDPRLRFVTVAVASCMGAYLMFWALMSGTVVPFIQQ